MALPSSLITEFAPRGKLRVALNHGNPILVSRNEEGPYGITVDLALRLGMDLGLEVEFVHFKRAVDVSDSSTSDLWDICFLAVDPDRAKTIDFTAPYVKIEGCYLASSQSPAANAHDVVNNGEKVGAIIGSAFALNLERKPGAENLVLYPDLTAELAAMDQGDVTVAAGIGSVMEVASRTRPGSRVLRPPFMEIRQAMAIVTGRPNASAYLKDWLADLAVKGVIGDILERHGVSRDCAVLPD